MQGHRYTIQGHPFTMHEYQFICIRTAMNDLPHKNFHLHAIKSIYPVMTLIHHATRTPKDVSKS